MTTLDQAQLKAMIDQYGLFAVVDTLSGIAGRKAEQSDNMLWLTAEAALNGAASRILDLDLDGIARK